MLAVLLILAGIAVGVVGAGLYFCYCAYQGFKR